MPKVSIIIPNYNHRPYLQQRLDTVFNQTFQDFEVILLDDASTDGSQQLLKTYQNHPKVSHAVYNTTNSGSPFKQWQKGIAMAKGEYIWIAESDDYCELDFLEQMLKGFGWHPKTVLVYCASTIINDFGEKKGRHKWADALDTQRWTQDFFNSGSNEIKHYLRYRNTITNASAVLFKKQATTNIHYPIDMRFCGDWLFWISLLKNGGIAYIGNELNAFRRHKNSTRPVQSVEAEKQRLKEYFKIVLNSSTWQSRICNLEKYAWIFKEWKAKEEQLRRPISINLPIEFKWLKYKYGN